jgi:hypothetical protein
MQGLKIDICVYWEIAKGVIRNKINRPVYYCTVKIISAVPYTYLTIFRTRQGATLIFT